MSGFRPERRPRGDHEICVVEGCTDAVETKARKTQATARSSLSAPRITIFSALSGNGRRGAFASSRLHKPHPNVFERSVAGLASIQASEPTP